MTHRFPIKEIARQAGLGTATVDRVLNGRAHVSPQTKLRVKAAIEESKTQETQLAARGRRLGDADAQMHGSHEKTVLRRSS